MNSDNLPVCIDLHDNSWESTMFAHRGAQLSLVHMVLSIRESVDSLCRDGADMPRPPYIGKACTRPNLEDLSLFRYLTIVYESLCTQ